MSLKSKAFFACSVTPPFLNCKNDSRVNEEQTRFLIDERKTGNEVYHKTPKRSKTDFWEEISNKLNEKNNTNYFTGEVCNKKFLSLTRAYYVSK